MITYMILVHKQNRERLCLKIFHSVCSVFRKMKKKIERKHDFQVVFCFYLGSEDK